MNTTKANKRRPGRTALPWALVVAASALAFTQNLNAQTWSPLAGGLGQPVFALMPEASGGSLLAGGGGPVGPGFVAQWNGTAWSPLGDNLNQRVLALKRHQGTLYAGGAFAQVLASELPANYIAQWNGTTWTPLPGVYGFNNAVRALGSYGGALIAGGVFAEHYSAPPEFAPTTTRKIARWDGTALTALPGFGHYAFADGQNNAINAVAEYNGELYVAGYFDVAHGDPGNHIARWNGTAWSAVGSGLNEKAFALTVHNGELYVGGSFTTAGGVAARGVAKWNGVAWSAAGSQDLRAVFALATFDGGLYAGGDFAGSDACAPQYVARLIGNNWVKVGDQVNNWTRALTAFNGDLVAGGDFTLNQPGTTSLSRVAKYRPGSTPDFLSVSAGPDAHIYIGYTPTNCVTRTATATGGTPPYAYTWTMNRPLLCNAAGNESFSSDACLNNACGSALPPSCAGATLTACLVDTARLTVTVTDANGCQFTSSATIFVEDVRCHAGNSGNQKVTICHGGKSICVDAHAVSAHLAHGDTIGPCPAPAP